METIDPVYARLILRELERDKADTDSLFAKTSMTRQELLRGGDIAMTDFLHILRRGQHMIGDDSLGLMLGRHANVLALGAVGAAMAVAPSIRQGLQVLDSFTRLHASYVRVSARSRPAGMRLEMTYASDPGELRRFHTETALMALQHYVETLWGKPLSGALFHLDYPAPDYAERYRDCLHGEVVFDAAAAAVDIPRESLDEPSPYYHADHWQATMGGLSQQLKDRAAEDASPYTQYVASILRSSEPPLPDLQQVANSLYVSERTLNRRLQQEGSNFRALKSDALMRWAKLYLSQTVHSVDSIAVQLGYQDTANFRRAFRRGAGCSPSEFRRQFA